MTTDYRGGRLAAEYASGIRGTRLSFTDGPDPWSVTVSDSGDGFPSFTPSNPTRPELAEVTVTLQGGTSQPLPAGLDLKAASALFWGEGAVEKFLIPYYTSASGFFARPFLQLLEDAWYGYDGTVVQVVALAHRCAAVPNASRVLEDTLQVLFYRVAGNGALEVASLKDFVDPARGYVGPGRGPQQQPLTLVPYGIALLPPGDEVGSVDVRDMAETISGTRGVQMTLASSQADGWNLWVGPAATLPAGWVAVTDVFSPLPRPDRPAVIEVTVTLDPATVKKGDSAGPYTIAPLADSTSPAGIADSFFWQADAVEKFLLPYYASVKGRIVSYYDVVLQGKWDGVTPPDAGITLATAVAGMVSLAPLVGSTQLGVVPQDGSSDTFGIIHLPRSEYIPEEELPGGGGLANRTVLLSHDPRDGFRADTLSGIRVG